MYAHTLGCPNSLEDKHMPLLSVIKGVQKKLLNYGDKKCIKCEIILI